MSKASQLCCSSQETRFHCFDEFFVVQIWEEKLLLDGVVANCTHNSSLECGLSAKTRREREEMCSISLILFFNFSSAYTRQLWQRLFHLFPGRFESLVAKVFFFQKKKSAALPFNHQSFTSISFDETANRSPQSLNILLTSTKFK